MKIHLIFNRSLINPQRNDLIRTRFTRAVIWTLLGSIISRFFSLICSIGLGRVLGVQLFGQLGLVQNLVILVGTTLSAGVSVAISKLIAESRDSELERLKIMVPMSIWISTAFGLILLVILLLLAPWLSTTVLNISELQNDFKLSLFFLFFSMVNGAILGIIAGMENFRAVGLLYSIRGFLFSVLSIGGALLGGFTGAVMGLVISELLSLIIDIWVTHWIFSKQYFVINYFKFSQLEARSIVGTAFPSLVSRIVVLPSIWFTSVFLVNQIGGINALGLFNASDKLRQLMLFLPITISGSILPILANLNDKREYRDFKMLAKTTLYLNLAICILPLLFLLLFSSPILSLYGGDFVKGSTTLQLLTLSTLPNIINIVYGQVLISLGQIWKRTLFDILLSIAIVITSIYFIPKFLDHGLALSYLISYSVTSSIMIIHYHFRLGKITSLKMIPQKNEVPF